MNSTFLGSNPDRFVIGMCLSIFYLYFVKSGQDLMLYKRRYLLMDAVKYPNFRNKLQNKRFELFFN